MEPGLVKADGLPAQLEQLHFNILNRTKHSKDIEICWLFDLV